MFKYCLICKTKIVKPINESKWHFKIKRKTCSVKCQHEWQKTRIPWNKGSRELCVAWNKGKKLHYPVWNKGLKGAMKGMANGMWKGDDVGYSALHDWVERELGKPTFCSTCKIAFSDKKYHWANKSHEYKRDLNDWIPMCVSCHKNYDIMARPV